MTAIEDRPVVHGLPVPYVANWTQEHWQRDRNDQVGGFMVGDFWMLNYTDETSSDRDEFGAMWIRNGLGGGGEPEFGQINAPRYRRAINRCLCQVCGENVSRDKTPWILPQSEMQKVEQANGLILTTNPPTCQNCWEPALRMCPHLKNGAHTVIVSQWRKYGILGEHYATPQSTPVMTMIPYSNRLEIGHAVAKQQLIAIEDFEEIA